jgi:hypothetical protein
MEKAMIIQILEQMVDIHKQLLEIETKKTKAIIHNDLDSLNKSIRAESRLIKQVEELEVRRSQESVRMYFSATNVFRRYVTLNNLITIVFEAETRLALQKLHFQLSSVVNELKKVIQHNRDLLKHSLEFIQFSFDIFVSPVDDSITYTHPQNPISDPSRFGSYNSKV